MKKFFKKPIDTKPTFKALDFIIDQNAPKVKDEPKKRTDNNLFFDFDL